MAISPFDFGVELAMRMRSELPKDSVTCKGLQTYGAIADMVCAAGDADYLEIGTWRGASAIVAARTKQAFKLGGMVYCVDHFKGYNDTFIDTTAALANFKNYGVDHLIKITISPSRPFPLDKGMRFRSAFIDGDHWKDNPYLDFVEIESMIDRFILFDDFNTDYEHSVMGCVEKVLREYPEWVTARQDDGFYTLLERKLNE